MLIKPIIVALGLTAGLALTAQAQTAQVGPAAGGPGPSIASLPPTDQGPRVYSHTSITAPTEARVVPSAPYPGPNPGATNGVMPPHFDKPADWDQNAAYHPYSSNVGPRAN